MKDQHHPPLRAALAVAALAAAALVPLSANADWKIVDDFETYEVGLLNAIESPWTAHRGTGTGAFFEEAGNQFLGFGWNGTSAYRSASRPLPEALAIQPGEQVTVFLRFRSISATVQEANFGLAFDTDTNDHGPLNSFRVQTGLRSNGSETPDFGVWDGDAFKTLTQIDLNTWYNLWYVIDHSAETFQLYLTTESEDATLANRLTDGTTDTFAFRSGGSPADVLNHILTLGNLGGTKEGTHLDNIWIDKSGENLEFVSLETLPGAIQWPYAVQFGSDGFYDGAKFVRNKPSEWLLQPDALRLEPDEAAFHDSFAMVNAINYQPGSDFAVRTRMTLTALGSGTADNAVGLALLGTGAPGTSDEFYRAQWVPNSSSGSRIQIVDGVNGTVLADGAWTGLHPDSGNPNEGIGATFTFLVTAEFQSGGALDLTFHLTDENGHSQNVTATISEPLAGNWFGLGARHSSSQNPAWDFVDFAIVEPWELDFEPMEAPFSLTFGMNTGNADGAGLLRNRPDAFELQWDALRYTSTGGFTSVGALASVENYVNNQDFTLEAEMTLRQIEDAALQRTGFAVLGGPHVPGTASFDIANDTDFYGLIWYPAVYSGDTIISRIEIRDGFNGERLAEAVWEGLHPSIENGGTGGIGNRYHMKAEGTYDAVGTLTLSFTLSDDVTDGAGHTQTISVELPNPYQGNLFGIGGRMIDGQFADPQFDYFTFSMNVGEPPSEVESDPAITWPFAFAYGSEEERNDDSDLRQNFEEEWSLDPQSLRLSPDSATYRNSLATTRVFNFEPGTDFFIRTRFTVESLAATEADNRVAIALFGDSDREVFAPANDSTYHTLQWIPAGPGGGSLVVRQGMNGAELSRTDFSALANPPVLTTGSPNDLYFHARYDEGGELEYVGILVDAEGREAFVSGTLASPPTGNRFGFGARHRSAESPIWTFEEFVWTGEATRPDRTITGAPVTVYATPGRTPDDAGAANAVGRRNVIDPDTGMPRHEGSYSTDEEYTFPSQSWVGNAGSVPHCRTHAVFLFFELPELTGEEWIDYAELSLVRLDDARGTGPGNIDIYGLGVVSATTLSSELWHAGPDDDSEGVQKLQDNYLASGDNTTTGRITTSIDGNESLTQYLQSLYSSGAQPGDYAVIRLSYDVDDNPNRNGTNRYQFQSASGSRGEDDPILTVYVGGREAPAGATFADWQSVHFTESELVDPAVSGPEAAPAGDGVPNLMKYAMNLDAKVPFIGSDLVSSAFEDGALTLTYLERKDVQDIEYVVESSADLLTWDSGPGSVEEIARVDDGDVEIVTVRAILTPGQPRAFLQLRIRQL